MGWARTLGWVVCASACARPARVEVEPVDVVLARVDFAWSRRAQIGLSAVGEALDAVPADVAASPAIGWRRARWHVAVAATEIDPLDARRAWAAGRAAGAACARVDEDTSPGDPMACGVWGGLAWARWLSRFGGAAAAVDAPAVRSLLPDGAPAALGARAAYAGWLLEASLGDGEALRAAWAVPPGDPRADPARAEERWVRWEDLVVLGLGEGLTPPEGPPVGPEEAGAWFRLQARARGAASGPTSPDGSTR
jgi:hypothetical protein